MLSFKNSNNFQRAAWVVFFLAFFVRVYSINIPFVEPYNNISRQSMCASVARNFYKHGFNLFYPEIDEGGKGPYLYNVEMPIYSYLMAIGYKLAGGVREGVARLVSVFFSMAMLAFVYLFTRRLSNERMALYALVFTAFSPMCVALSRSIQPDITMVSAGVGALYTFYRYLESRKALYFIASALLFLLAVLTKGFALYIFIPIVYMAWVREGRNLFLNWRNYLYAGIVSLGLLWYGYMWYMDKTLALHYKPFEYAPEQLRGHFNYFRLFAPSYLKFPLKVFFVHILTPLGALLFFSGLFQRIHDRSQRLMFVWLGSVVIYLLAAWSTAVSHPYYFLPLLPVIAFFVAQGAERVFSHPSWGKWIKSPAVVVLVLVVQLFWLGYFYRLLYFIPPDRWAIVRAGQFVNDFTPQNSLVIASWGGSPIQLYYCNRKGWAFNFERSDEIVVREFDAMRNQGASFFVTSTPDKLKKSNAFAAYLTRYPVARETGEFIVFDLRPSSQRK